jgi:heptosyltransferase I
VIALFDLNKAIVRPLSGFCCHAFVTTLPLKCGVRVLLVKLSSMGDVIHNLPVVTDLHRAFPAIEIDWVTEAPYAELVALHPKVKQIFPIHLRALKKQWWRLSLWAQFREERNRLATQQYDCVIDTQGLVKSAMVARGANQPISGFSKSVAREPMAARFYARAFDIAREQHAVERNRLLVAAAMGYKISTLVDYGLNVQMPRPAWLSGHSYIVLLHATSRADKEWPITSWVALAKKLNDRGLMVVLPWGNENEKGVSEKIAAEVNHVIVPPAMNLAEAAKLLANATGVVGVDTGLAHLAVAFDRPTVGIYVSTEPALTGLYGNTSAINLGGGSMSQLSNPSMEAVFAALLPHLPLPAEL